MEKFKKLSHDIGIELLKLTKNKKNICVFANIKENDSYDDLFPVLCYRYQFLDFRGINVDFFDDRNTNLNEIYNDYDLVIHITGKRFQSETTAVLIKNNDKEITIEFSSEKEFTGEIEFCLCLSFEYGIYDYIDDAPHKWHKEIKPEYKHLLWKLINK